VRPLLAAAGAARDGWAPVVGVGCGCGSTRGKPRGSAQPPRGKRRGGSSGGARDSKCRGSSSGGGAGLAAVAGRGEGEGQVGRLGSWAGPPPR